MKNANYNLGCRIKSIRKQKGLKANFVAKVLKIHPSTLSKYESNERQIKGSQLPEFASALGCSVDDFFDQKVGETSTKITA